MRTLKEQVPLEERRQRTEPWSLHHEEEKTSQKPEEDQLVRWRGSQGAWYTDAMCGKHVECISWATTAAGFHARSSWKIQSFGVFLWNENMASSNLKFINRKTCGLSLCLRVSVKTGGWLLQRKGLLPPVTRILPKAASGSGDRVGPVAVQGPAPLHGKLREETRCCLRYLL